MRDKFTVIWVDEGGAHEEGCRDVGAVREELAHAGSASQSADAVEEAAAWCEGAQPGEVHAFPSGWVIRREAP